jgi:hypothetical protein
VEPYTYSLIRLHVVNKENFTFTWFTVEEIKYSLSKEFVCLVVCQNKRLQFFCGPLVDLISEFVFFDVRTEVFDVYLLFKSAFYFIKN